MADTKLSTKQRFGFAAVPLALIGALVAALGTNDSAHEGRRYTPYYDSAGILTVCAGITGPAVVKGKRYADEECTRLETAYVRTMLGHMGQCVRGEFEFHEIKAWGHFAYNIGTPAFCVSTAAKRLNAGERQPAAPKCGSGGTSPSAAQSVTARCRSGARSAAASSIAGSGKWPPAKAACSDDQGGGQCMVGSLEVGGHLGQPTGPVAVAQHQAVRRSP